MIDKKSIIKMAEHVFRKSQGYPDRRLMHPKREWGIGIGIFLVLVSAGAIGAFSVFTSYRDFSQVTASVEQSVSHQLPAPIKRKKKQNSLWK